MIKEKYQSIIKIVKPVAIALLLFLLVRYSVATTRNQVETSAGLPGENLSANDYSDFNYDFTIRDLQGKNINVSEYKGKIIFLNIWATWCGPCRAEMAGIQELYSKIDKKNISFIMLSIDQQGQVQKVKDYVASKQFTFPVFTPYNGLPEQLQVSSIPTTFIIGKDGQVISKQVGSTNFNTPEFKKYLEGLAGAEN